MDHPNIFIGDLSQKTGVPVKTIRYYEDFGILARPKRAASAYRIYTLKDVEKLSFIKKAKELGLKLSEIKKIILRSEKGLNPCCSFVRDLFNEKIREYETRIAEMTGVKKRLENKLKSWVKSGQAKGLKYAVCPQIERTKTMKGGKENGKKKR